MQKIKNARTVCEIKPLCFDTVLKNVSKYQSCIIVVFVYFFTSYLFCFGEHLCQTSTTWLVALKTTKIYFFYSNLINFHRQKRRVIPESEYGLALLHCSVEKYCNSRIDAGTHLCNYNQSIYKL